MEKVIALFNDAISYCWYVRLCINIAVMFLPARDSVARNLYLTCRMLWSDDDCRSQVCWGTADPQFQLSQVKINTNCNGKGLANKMLFYFIQNVLKMLDIVCNDR